MKKDNGIYLRHIYDAISRIEEYITGIKHGDFIKNHLIQDGVIRQIEIIGEATKKISIEIRDEHPGIPWKDMAGMRDKLIHDYMGVDIDAVWDTVKEDIPVIKRKMKGLIEKGKNH